MNGGSLVTSSQPPQDQQQQQRSFLARATNKCTGLLILSACLLSLLLPFKSSLTKKDILISADNSNALLLHALLHATLVALLLNSTSHAAVVLNLLEDTLIISILIGVSFDILSELIYLSLWACVYFCGDIILPPSFMVIYATYASYHLIVHIRALLMTRSFRRLESVVRSAYNNIVGDPGWCYLDHFFAFTDTGFHLFHLGVAGYFFGVAKSAVICLGVFVVLAAAVGTTCLYDKPQSIGDKDTTATRRKDISNTLGKLGDKPICRCKTCTAASGADGSAFCMYLEGRQISVCRLWKHSFREVLLEINRCSNCTKKRD